MAECFNNSKDIKVKLNRTELLETLANMPDESFGWFVAWCMGGFPDGLGGFTDESKKSIIAIRKAANKYIDV